MDEVAALSGNSGSGTVCTAIVVVISRIVPCVDVVMVLDQGDHESHRCFIRGFVGLIGLERG